MYAAGNLAGAIEEITREVKANPTDTARRSFLFELLCFAGEWDRAEKQLDVLAGQGATAEVGAKVYRNNLRAERERARLISEVSEPHFLAEPPAYVDMHLEALRQIRDGNTQAARDTLDRAEEERPALAGTLDGAAFEDLRDYDDRFAPVLEIIVSDKYTWLPFEQIKRIEVEPPEQLRDLIWARASIETNDNELKAFLRCSTPTQAATWTTACASVA
jgi:type VI secretion system protein ImpE